ncbi:MAG: lysylphosphatidylglycerol synthase transmembrane domain-containing protein [bacterium]|nr:lysylphosphatidylglycerol synthase transmembrane domain-containing protein [bacterium]
MGLISKKKILILVLTCGVFAILFSIIDFRDVVSVLKRANFGYLAVALVVMFSFPLLSALRWKWIAAQVGAELSLWDSVRIIMAAWPLGSVTPAKSGDLVKLLFLRNILPYSKTTGVILAERLMDVVALCLYAMVMGIVMQFFTATLIASIVLAAVFSGLFLIQTPLFNSLPAKWLNLARQVMAATQHIFSNKTNFCLIFFITALNWFMSFFQTWLCYRAFNSPVPLSYILAALPIAIFVGLIPVTLSGMGTREGAVMMLFQEYASQEVNFSVGIMYSIFGYWLLTLLGIPFMNAALRGSIGGVKGEELWKSAFTDEDADLEEDPAFAPADDSRMESPEKKES